MLKYLPLTLLVFIQVTLIHAQVATNGMISGQVQLENNQPALNATVVLQRSADSVLVKTALPNEDGVFEFENIKPGAYVVVADLRRPTFVRYCFRWKVESVVFVGLMHMPCSSKFLL